MRDFICLLPQTAARYAIEPRTYSYAQTAQAVEALRNRYRSAGYGHGHRAGLLLENRPAFFFHWLALNALGVSVVPIHPDWRAGELEYLLGHSEMCLAIAPAARGRILARAAEQVGSRLVVATESLDDLEDAPLGAPAANRPPDIDTEAALLYTSGSTGRPKGCVLANEYFLWGGKWYLTLGGLCAVRPHSDRLITPLPMSHMNAMAFSSMVMLLTGGCVVPLDRFHPESWWDCVRDSRATIVHYLGVMPAMLLGAAASPRDRDHQVRFGLGSGVGNLHAAFEERFGFPLVEGWAMTEAGAGAAIVASSTSRKVGTACIGRPAAGIDYRLVDELGNNVPNGERGELLVRRAGPRPRFGFFREYLKDPLAMAAAWKDGYFHTGDIVQVDADGDFHFIDRQKNIIRRSGENISAVEVEGVLLQHPQVAAVGVTAVPDAVRGDEVMACIVLRKPIEPPDRDALARDIVEFCLARLAYFKAPGYVTFCERLPLTSTEKVQRTQLRDLSLGALGGASCIDMRAAKKRESAG
ncbi:MAG: AMP-binding protein [Steroidobacteraceae bacterium]